LGLVTSGPVSWLVITTFCREPVSLELYGSETVYHNLKEKSVTDSGKLNNKYFSDP